MTWLLMVPSDELINGVKKISGDCGLYHLGRHQSGGKSIVISDICTIFILYSEN
ncbi:hypothetical protein [Alteribacillus sp. HJP-4]|uniref:hypothetical protein n=1 Tax=Alteribacillus sp. HJP-4 TaxID=2775394 RepID=UPI0035CCD86A